jgi:protein-tyrosine phosphatase
VIWPTFEWVDANDRFRLAIMPCPRPDQLEAHLLELKAKGADVVVSMLEPEEAGWLGVAEEGELCAKAGIRFYQHPVPDHSTPTDRAAAEAFARELIAELEAGRGVVIHCYAGIGRSATMAATVLILAGFTLEEACDRLSAARRVRVPETPRQREWLAGLRRPAPEEGS